MRVIKKVSVDDVEKKKYPDKHYVYVIRVGWSDGNVNVIYRRYSRFFSMQSRILDKFPKEAGVYNPRDRIIPFLPGKIFFGRSQVRRVAEERKNHLNEYCKSLIRLREEISQSKEVLLFFGTSEDDLRPTHQREVTPINVKGELISEPEPLDQYFVIEDYRKDGRNETSLIAGTTVEVVEKNETGWWFVNSPEGQGWVPSSYLEKPDGEDNRILDNATGGTKYICTHDYDADDTDEITLRKGGYVKVLEKNFDGWWLVEFQGRQGRAPRTYLSAIDTLKARRLLKRSVIERDSNDSDHVSPATINEIRRKARENGKHQNANSKYMSKVVMNPARVTQEAKLDRSKIAGGNPALASSKFQNDAQNNELKKRFNQLHNASNVDHTKQQNKPTPAKRVKSPNRQINSPWQNKTFETKPKMQKPVPPPQHFKPKFDNRDEEQQEYENADAWLRPNENTIAEQINSNESLASIESSSSEDCPTDYKIPQRRKALTNSLSRQSGHFDNNHASPPLTIYKEEYRVKQSYNNQAGDGIDLTRDEVVEVLEKTDSGWWFVKRGVHGEGWAPASYLEPVAPQVTNRPTPPKLPSKGAVKQQTQQSDSSQTSGFAFKNELANKLQKNADKQDFGFKKHGEIPPTSPKPTRQPGKSDFRFQSQVVSNTPSPIRKTNKNVSVSSQNHQSPEETMQTDFRSVLKSNGANVPTKKPKPTFTVEKGTDYENEEMINSLKKSAVTKPLVPAKSNAPVITGTKPPTPVKIKPNLPTKSDMSQVNATAKASVNTRVNKVRQMFENS